ncbi:MAG: hypothetical protein ACOYL6_09430 [Bacteriovoracaceae bacterium]
MKKTIVLVLALTSVSAFASKARLEALGEGGNGSFYIQDNRNMFLNPAAVNYHKDFLTFEWGTTQTAGTDSVAAPRSEGGFFRSMGALNYGLYLGSQDSAMGTRRYGASSDANFTNQNNPVDLFVGGEASSMKWGANLTYSTAETNNAGSFKKNEDYMALKAGVEMNNLEVFAKTDIVNKAKGATQANDEYKGTLNGSVGASYMLNDLKIYGQFAKVNATFKDETGSVVNESKFADHNYKIGVGRTAAVNDKTKVFTRVEYSVVDTNTKRVDNNHYNTHTMTLPVAIGLEHDALSWLMLRGSVTQDLWSNATTDTTAVKRANNTAVNMGATLALGSVKLDGLVGTTPAGAAGAPTSGTGSGALSLDRLMTRVALRYNF